MHWNWLSRVSALLFFFTIGAVALAQPAATLTDVTQNEGSGGGTTSFTFDVTLSEPAPAAASIEWIAADDSANAGSDFTAANGMLTFNIGEQVKSVTIDVSADDTSEPNETFFVNFFNPSNVTLPDTQALGTIANDDGPGVFIDDVSMEEGDSGSTFFNFTVGVTQTAAFDITVTATTINGTAIAGPFADFLFQSTQVTIPANTPSATFSVEVNGETDVESDETFFVELTDPISGHIVDAQGTGTIENDDSPEITISDASVTEGDGGTTTLTFLVSMSEEANTDVSVTWTTADDSATTADNDYAGNTGTLTIPRGEMADAINITVNGDTNVEPNERMFVNLSDPVNASINDTQGEGTIVNDDWPSITISDPSVAEGDSLTTTLSYIVTLSAATSENVSVTWETANGTATVANNDYVANANTLVIPQGSTTGQIDVVVNGDVGVESDETVLVNLSLPLFATLAETQGVGTITNDDEIPAITISDPSVVEGDALTTTLSFIVTLSDLSAEDVSVTWTTDDGTATTANNDYVAGTNTLVIPALSTSGQIDITVNGDVDVEPNETVLVNLSNPINATIGDPQGAGTITNDDEITTTTLTIQKTGPASVLTGANVVYTIAVTNTGLIDATNVVVTDPIPADTTFVSATPTQGSCSGTTTVTCTLGTLAPSASATITLTVQAPFAPASLTNTATVNADQTTAAESSSAATTVTASAEVPIPTLSEWMLIALATALATVAAMKMRA